MPSPTAANYLAGFEQAFTPEASAFFDRNGYYVFGSEGASSDRGGDVSKSPFSDTEARQFQTAIKKAYLSGKMFPNKVEFLLASGPIQLVKPNVFEYDMHNATAEKDVPVMHDFFRNHMGGIANLMKKVSAENSLGVEKSDSASSSSSTTAGAAGEEGAVATPATSTTPCSSTSATLSTMNTNPQTDMTLKLQVNTGGCFPWHYDNPSPPNKRLLTLAVYLTDPYDEDTHGGQVQLLPFLGKPITIAPKFNTVVLFRSDLMLHRVLPFTKVAAASGTGGGSGKTQQQQQQQKKMKNDSNDNFRCCFTVWLDSNSTNMPDDVNLKAKNLVSTFIPQMITSPVQRSLSRAVYDDIYQKALIDCFGEGTREAVISLRMHEAHVKALMNNPALAQFVELLKAKREY